MAYDYSRGYLDRHRDLADQLEGIYRDGGHRSMVFDRADDLQVARTTINNVLASLALYDPSKRAMRQRIRTWYEYKDERWYLHVGLPTHKLRGSTNQQLGFTTAHAQAGLPEAGVLRYEHEIRTQQDILKFLGWFTEKAKQPEITGVKMEVNDAPKSVAYWREIIDGWDVQVLGESTIQLMRESA